MGTSDRIVQMAGATDWYNVGSRRGVPPPRCIDRAHTPTLPQEQFTSMKFASPSVLLVNLSLAVAVAHSVAAPPDAPKSKARADRSAPMSAASGENQATPISRIKAAKDFQVELLYSVPGPEQGSWVNLCADDKGRILASDQYGGLFRFPPPPPGMPLDPKDVQKLPVDIRAVNGMVFAFGALYVGVNDYEGVIPCGLYRITSSKGDGELDKVELLRAMDAKGDHGVHAVVPTPDGKALYLICGNGTKTTAFESTSQVRPCR